MKSVFLVLAVVLFYVLPAQSQTDQPLTLIQTIAMPNVPNGPFTDHLAVDLKGHRLFATPQAKHSVQIFDLNDGKLLHEITGLGNPHAVVYRSDLDRILVVDGGEPSLIRAYYGKDYHSLQTVKLLQNADGMTYDPEAKLMFVTNGGEEANLDYSFISVIDTTTLQKVSDIKIPGAALEQMSLEPAGARLYVDITDKNEVGVVDRQKRSLLATWPITKGTTCISNSLDEANHRLFVGCRNSDMSGAIVVFDTESGKETGTTLPIGGDVDNMFFDPVSKRLYASCGTGHVYVYQQSNPDHYDLIGKAETGVMAKTSLLVPELQRFFVSVPHIGGQSAKVLVFQIH